MIHLYTKAEYDRLVPRTQGYLAYMQGDFPGSELKDLKNPYPIGSIEYERWQDGQLAGVLVAQDSEE